jgi:hypothetical protein|tara:strand:- start:64 stop:306 length:243 start_codon:yes stop_codon:yes gene_type:complete
MENTQEIKTQVLERVPPGDRWKPVGRTDMVFESLTDGLEWCYHETGCRDYHLAALDGKVYSVDRVEVAPKPPQKFSLYGE